MNFTVRSTSKMLKVFTMQKCRVLHKSTLHFQKLLSNRAQLAFVALHDQLGIIGEDEGHDN